LNRAIIFIAFPPEPQSHTLFVRNLPYQLSPEKLYSWYRPFGEIAKADVNDLHNRGIAFVSFFDKRAAVRAVERMQGFQSRGRNVVTGFASQQFEGSALLVRPIQIGPPKPSLEICRYVLSAFGEIERLQQMTDGFIVEFFDVRSARSALSNSGRIVIAGNLHSIEPFEPEREQSVPQRLPGFPPPQW
jgi:RNA recognition motif-containing protein